MTRTLPGADVRGFYTALGVHLPDWARTEASVPCFADPDAHQHQDRAPSRQVNLASGAFNCHGCGAHDGAYDAALATGRSPREAIDLMVAHALTERRPRSRDTSRSTRPASASTGDATTAAENPGSRARATNRPRPAPSSPARPASLPAARTVEPQRT
jgi:hypothetical protein